MYRLLQHTERFLERHDKLVLAIMLIVGFLLTYSRNPDILTNAEFWAEDATIWFADAYDDGLLSTIFRPYPDVITLCPRIIAGLAVWLDLPLRIVPLFFSLSAICIQLLPLVIIMGGRLENIFRSRLLAIAVSLVYIGFLNNSEILGSVANLQWSLGITAFLVLISGAARNRAWAVFDVFIIIFAGLNGPNAILLFPVALILWLCSSEGRRQLSSLLSRIQNRRVSSRKVMTKKTAGLHGRRLKSKFFNLISDRRFILVLLGLMAALQLLMSLVISHYSRVGAHPNADFLGFAKIIVGQIFVAGTLGDKYTALFYDNHALLYSALVAGFALVSYCLVKGPLWLKVFIMFGALTVTIVLFTIKATPLYDVWAALSMPSIAKRYWFFAICAWFASILWLVLAAKSKLAKVCGIILLSLMVFIGIPQGWRLPSRPDNNFPAHANNFESLPKGTKYTIPINPGWYLELTKK